MGRNQKRINKMRRNPKNVPYRDIETVLLSLGFDHRSRGTSHNVFTVMVDETKHRLVVPMKKPHVKRFYVEELLQLIDQLGLLDEDDEELDEKMSDDDDNEVNDDEKKS